MGLLIPPALFEKGKGISERVIGAFGGVLTMSNDDMLEVAGQNRVDRFAKRRRVAD